MSWRNARRQKFAWRGSILLVSPYVFTESFRNLSFNYHQLPSNPPYLFFYLVTNKKETEQIHLLSCVHTTKPHHMNTTETSYEHRRNDTGQTCAHTKNEGNNTPDLYTLTDRLCLHGWAVWLLFCFVLFFFVVVFFSFLGYFLITRNVCTRLDPEDFFFFLS